MFNFAVTTKPVSKRTSAKRDRIAREVGGRGCGYTTITEANGTPKSWGYAPNRGFPFDSQTAREIEAAWKAAGVG